MGAFRLFLACLVVACHTRGCQPPAFPNLGPIAVATFFFISGYLMPLTFETNYRQPGFGARFASFARSRFLRIYPIYWASLVVIILHGWLRPVASTLACWAHPTLFLQNFALVGLNQDWLTGHYMRLNNPAWSLDIELQYYLLVPVLALAWKRAKTPVALGLAAASVASLGLMAFPTRAMSVDRSLLAFSALFFGGFLFYQFAGLKSLFDPARAGLAGAVVAVAGLPLSGRAQTVVLTLGLVLAACHFLVRQARRAYSALDGQLGDLSYPVYIFHLTILESMEKRIVPFVERLHLSPSVQVAALAACNIALALVGAVVVLKLVDDPIKRLRGRRPAAAAAPIPAADVAS